MTPLLVEPSSFTVNRYTTEMEKYCKTYRQQRPFKNWNCK